MHRSIGAIVLAGALLGGCASDIPSAATVSTAAPPPPMSTTATDGSATTVAPDSTTTAGRTDPSTDAPEPVMGPQAGSSWIVVGVAHDDLLNVRSGPGVGNPVVGTLAATAEGVVVSGNALGVGTSIWWEMRSPTIGWANSAFFAIRGRTDDVTAELVEVNGQIPIADTMEDLVEIVTNLRSVGGTESIVVSRPSGDGVHSEAIVDVLVFGDDAVRGERLHVFGQRAEPSGPFSLLAVEVSTLCWRGADTTGSCL